MGSYQRRIHGLLCECEMCTVEASVESLGKALGWSTEDALAAVERVTAEIRSGAWVVGEVSTKPGGPT